MALEKNFILENGTEGNYTRINQFMGSFGEIIIDTELFKDQSLRQGEKPSLEMNRHRIILNEQQKKELYVFLYGIIKGQPEFDGAIDVDPDDWKNEPQIGEGE
jgi:hypothetical protein